MAECWIMCSNVTDKKIAWCSQGALKSCMSCSSAIMDMCLTIPWYFTVNSPYYCSLVQDKVRPACRCKQPELLESGVILVQENATPHCQCDVQNLVKHWGWNIWAHPPYSPNLTPWYYWLFACVKEELWGKSFESEDDIKSAITASLYCLSKDKYSGAVDHVSYRREKCVDYAGEYIE